MIARLVDPEKLEELIFNLEIKSAISNDAKDWLKLLLKYLKCLKNLTNVQTNPTVQKLQTPLSPVSIFDLNFFLLLYIVILY